MGEGCTLASLSLTRDWTLQLKSQLRCVHHLGQTASAARPSACHNHRHASSLSQSPPRVTTSCTATTMAACVTTSPRTHTVASPAAGTANDTCIAEYVATPAMDNGNRQVMGGFLAAMMDVTVAQAVVVHSGITQTVSTLEQKTSLLAPVRLSAKTPSEQPVRLRCEATAIKRGRTVAFYEVSLLGDKGEMIARATQTTLLLDIPKRDAKNDKTKAKPTAKL